MKQDLAARRYEQVLESAEDFLSRSPNPALYSVAAAAAYGLSLYTRALQYVEEALVMQPGSKQLEESRKKILSKLETEG